MLLWIDGTAATYTGCNKGLSYTASLGIEGTDVIHMGHPWGGGAHRVALDRWMYRTQNVVREGLTPCPSGSMGPLHLTAGVVGEISHRSFESMNDVACKQIHEGMSHIVFLWIDETDVTYCGNREGGYHTVLLWMVGGGGVEGGKPHRVPLD